MLVLEPFTEDHGRLMVQAHAFPPVRLLAPRGSAAHRLAYMLDSLVRVSRRADRKPSANIQRAQLPKGSKSALMVPRSAGRHGLEANPALLPPRSIDADRHPAPVADKLPTSARAHRRLPIPSPSTISSTFNSLFKVLFIFPSRYLFAIGLPSIFSLRWDLPSV